MLLLRGRDREVAVVTMWAYEVETVLRVSKAMRERWMWVGHGYGCGCFG
jgi:hypothetical protein